MCEFTKPMNWILAAVGVVAIGCQEYDDHAAQTPGASRVTLGRANTSVSAEHGGYSGALERDFPKDFLFGTAIAGFQADMGCPSLSPEQCTDANSDWYAFATSPETVNDPATFLSGQDPAVVGPGFWELFPQDLWRAAMELHNKSFRMSIEWSRVFPTSTVGIDGYWDLRWHADHAALRHYHHMFAVMRLLGLEPLVTLNHYSLPTWVHDAVGCHQDLSTCTERGWLDHDFVVDEMAKYAGFVAREFGWQVDLWATLNEPMAVVYAGYIGPSPLRSNPPSVTMAGTEAKTALHNMIDAHARMYDAVIANDFFSVNWTSQPASVGVVFNMSPVIPADPENPLDQLAATNVFYLWNLAFLDAVCLGEFSQNLDGVTTYRPDLDGRMDFLGINYYNKWQVEGLPFPVLPEFSVRTTFNPATTVADIIDPSGMHEVVMFATERYDVPIYITENGAMHAHNEPVIVDYLRSHLGALLQAMREGADVRGYYFWTLTDNFEWNHGMNFPFGLYSVDYTNPDKPRSARLGAKVYGDIAATGVLP